jgi:hypothetical protein
MCLKQSLPYSLVEDARFITLAATFDLDPAETIV